jgi:hypothetical protein
MLTRRLVSLFGVVALVLSSACGNQSPTAPTIPGGPGTGVFAITSSLSINIKTGRVGCVPTPGFPCNPVDEVVPQGGVYHLQAGKQYTILVTSTVTAATVGREVSFDIVENISTRAVQSGGTFTKDCGAFVIRSANSDVCPLTFTARGDSWSGNIRVPLRESLGEQEAMAESTAEAMIEP